MKVKRKETDVRASSKLLEKTRNSRFSRRDKNRLKTLKGKSENEWIFYIGKIPRR